jgi:FixJ family two-component response regulator
MESFRNIYVAIVDDDESICRSLGRLLRAAKFQPITYASAEAFLEDLKHPQFDCLVLDVRLGGMSGIELHKQLTAGGSTTAVVFMTAHDDPDVRMQALASGASACLRKTVDGQALLEAVHLAVRGPHRP